MNGVSELQQLLSSLVSTAPTSTPVVQIRTHHQAIEITAANCLLGGGVEGLGSAWNVYSQARNSVGMVPDGRWEGLEKLEGRVLYGAFLPRIDLFDHRAFGLAPVEAFIMDPHQRLVLEQLPSSTSML